jgi:hypothetical protein
MSEGMKTSDIRTTVISLLPSLYATEKIYEWMESEQALMMYEQALMIYILGGYRM